MSRTDIVDLHTPWECRWTRVGLPLRRGNRRQEQTVVWICTRGGCRRHVNDEECETCEFWEDVESDGRLAGPVEHK
jgi:hypothetical protein